MVTSNYSVYLLAREWVSFRKLSYIVWSPWLYMISNINTNLSKDYKTSQVNCKALRKLVNGWTMLLQRTQHSVIVTGLCCAWSLQSCQPLCNPTDGSPCPWQYSPGKNTGGGCHVLLQGIFLTQGLKPGLPHCSWILYCLRHQGRPVIDIAHFKKSVMKNFRWKVALKNFIKHEKV